MPLSGPFVPASDSRVHGASLPGELPRKSGASVQSPSAQVNATPVRWRPRLRLHRLDRATRPRPAQPRKRLLPRLGRLAGHGPGRCCLEVGRPLPYKDSFDAHDPLRRLGRLSLEPGEPSHEADDDSLQPHVVPALLPGLLGDGSLQTHVVVANPGEPCSNEHGQRNRHDDRRQPDSDPLRVHRSNMSSRPIRGLSPPRRQVQRSSQLVNSPLACV